MRSRIESFVDKLYPLRQNKTGEMLYGKPENLSYCDALNEILVSTNVRFTSDLFVMMVRNRLIEGGITASVFMKFSRWLYNQFTDELCHKMAKFSPPIPSYRDTSRISEMLQCVEVDPVDIPPAIVCVQLILQPLDMPPTCSTTGSTTN